MDSSTYICPVKVLVDVCFYFKALNIILMVLFGNNEKNSPIKERLSIYRSILD